MKHLLSLLLLTASVAYSQTTVIGGSGGGGASAANDLSDVTITSRAADDILVDNGSGAYVNEQILEAIGSRLTNGSIPYTASGVLTDGTSLTFNASASLAASGTLRVADSDLNQASVEIYSNVNGATNPFLLFTSDNTAGTRNHIGSILGLFTDRTTGSEDGSLRFITETGSAATEKFTIGGSQTALVQDQTATTGDTKFIVKAGAGQAANLFEVQNSSGTVLHGVTAAGNLIGSGSKTWTGLSILLIDFTTYFGSSTLAGSRSAVGNGFMVGSAYQYRFSSTSGANGSPDAGLSRQAAGILEVTDGSTGLGYLKAGSFDIEDGGTKPTCDSSTRGYIWNDEGATTVADVAEICAKDTDDAYYWKPLLNDVVAVNIDLDDAMVASTGDGKYYFFIDASLNGYDLTDVSLSNDVPGTTSGTLTIDLARCTIGAAICSTEAAILTTKLSVDYDEFSSLTAATAAVINTSNNAVSTGQRIRVDVDAIAGGTAATDVKIGFVFTKRS